MSEVLLRHLASLLKRRRPYFSPLHTPPEDPNLANSAIQHFHDKLVHIKDRLKTAPGRAMGERRHQVVSLSPLHYQTVSPDYRTMQLLDFIASIDEEYEGKIP